MRTEIRVGVLAGAVLLSGTAEAQTEIQWWHSMSGQHNEKINQIATGFNAGQKYYKVVPVFKASYPESMTAAIAAFRARSPPHIVQAFEVVTATIMTATDAINPIHQLVNGARVPSER